MITLPIKDTARRYSYLIWTSYETDEIKEMLEVAKKYF